MKHFTIEQHVLIIKHYYRNGGSLVATICKVIRLRKGQAGRAWENLCMAMLGEQFMTGNEICGVVVSIRYQEDSISVWNRTSSDQAATARIRDVLKRLLNLPVNFTMEYKTHNDSLKAWKTTPNSLKS